MQAQHHRAILRQLLPGMILPGLIYFVATLGFGAGVILGLTCASAVPLIDVLTRVVRGKAPTAASLLFVCIAGCSVTLAVISGSKMLTE